MLLYSLTIFLSAFLLFQVQPIIAKMILPWFGGSSAVWSTCMLFFQVVLLLGYLYAHWLHEKLAPRRQAVAHIAALVVSFAALPTLPNPGWKSAGMAHPSLTILAEPADARAGVGVVRRLHLLRGALRSHRVANVRARRRAPSGGPGRRPSQGLPPRLDAASLVAGPGRQRFGSASCRHQSSHSGCRRHSVSVDPASQRLPVELHRLFRISRVLAAPSFFRSWGWLWGSWHTGSGRTAPTSIPPGLASSRTCRFAGSWFPSPWGCSRAAWCVMASWPASNRTRATSRASMSRFRSAARWVACSSGWWLRTGFARTTNSPSDWGCARPSPSWCWREACGASPAYGRDGAPPIWPVTYFCPQSGIGLAMQAQEGPPRRIGILGLGCGTLAAYGRPGDTLRIYEINPLLLDIARREFTYLRDTPARVEVAVGDGRLILESEPGQQFDLLVTDAFSSDSVPVHLITREAFRTYFRHLKPDGILAVNITNTYLDLRPVVERAAAAFGKVALVYDYTPDGNDFLCFGCSWTLIMDRATAAAHPGLQHAGKVLRQERPFRTWTDDFSNMFSILR